jgi:hypothetical protein
LKSERGEFYSLRVYSLTGLPHDSKCREVLYPLQRRTVKFQRVAAQNRFFIFVREVIAREQLVNFVAAFDRVENFVREIAAEEKRLAAAFRDGGI